jgi:hypothetical protein
MRLVCHSATEDVKGGQSPEAFKPLLSSDKSLHVASARLEKQDKLKLVALQPRLAERSAVLEEASGGQSSEVFKPLLSPERSLVAASARLE